MQRSHVWKHELLLHVVLGVGLALAVRRALTLPIRSLMLLLDMRRLSMNEHVGLAELARSVQYALEVVDRPERQTRRLEWP